MKNNMILFTDTMSRSDFMALTRAEMIEVLEVSNDEAYYYGFQNGLKCGYWCGAIITTLIFVLAYLINKIMMKKR